VREKENYAKLKNFGTTPSEKIVAVTVGLKGRNSICTFPTGTDGNAKNTPSPTNVLYNDHTILQYFKMLA